MKRLVMWGVIGTVMFAGSWAYGQADPKIGIVEFRPTGSATGSRAYKVGDTGSLVISSNEHTIIISVVVTYSNRKLPAVRFDNDPAKASGSSWSTSVSFIRKGSVYVKVTFQQPNRKPETRYVEMTSAYVLPCAYTFGGTEPFTPQDPATVSLKHLDDISYSIDVKPEVGVTMKKVYDGLDTPYNGKFIPNIQIEGWNVKYETINPDPACPECQHKNLKCVYAYVQAPAKITMSYRFKMPKWTHLKEAGTKAQADWNKFYTALKAHENGHLDIFKPYKEKFEALTKIKGVGKSHLLTLSKVLAGNYLNNNHTVYNLILDCLIDDAEYDYKTNHGINQAAVGGTNIVTDDSIPTTE